MKTHGMIAAAMLANSAVAVEPTQREKIKREQEKAIKKMQILKECCDTKWTFATKKLKGGSCILLAKPKYSYNKYRAVCLDGITLKFQTKTSAHNAAKVIAEIGFENSGYELGEAYEI